MFFICQPFVFVERSQFKILRPVVVFQVVSLIKIRLQILEISDAGDTPPNSPTSPENKDSSQRDENRGALAMNSPPVPPPPPARWSQNSVGARFSDVVAGNPESVSPTFYKRTARCVQPWELSYDGSATALPMPRGISENNGVTDTTGTENYQTKMSIADVTQQLVYDQTAYGPSYLGPPPVQDSTNSFFGNSVLIVSIYSFLI